MPSRRRRRSRCEWPPPESPAPGPAAVPREEENSELPGIGAAGDECALGLALSEIYVCNASRAARRCRMTSGEAALPERNSVSRRPPSNDRMGSSCGRFSAPFPNSVPIPRHDKWDLEFRHAAHQLWNLGLYALELRFGRLQYELVVHLHDELGGKPFASSHPRTAIIASLIRSAAVPCIGRVDRSALGSAAARRIRALDLGQPQAPPKHGLDIAAVARVLRVSSMYFATAG